MRCCWPSIRTPGGVVTAEAGRRRRARRSRCRWASTPPVSRPKRWGWLPLLTGLAVAETVRDRGVDAGLKWPNDVLVGTGKLAGILAEVAAPVIVVGLGLNVSLTGDELPDPNAVSLSMLGQAADRTGLAVALLHALSDRLREVACRQRRGRRFGRRLPQRQHHDRHPSACDSARRLRNHRHRNGYRRQRPTAHRRCGNDGDGVSRRHHPPAPGPRRPWSLITV